MKTGRKLGAWSSFACRPLIQGLTDQSMFVVDVDSPAPTAFKLRDNDLEIGFLSPIDYAKDSSHLVIVPEVALWSESGAMVSTIHFRTGLHDVATLAVDPSSASEVILAKIVLEEEFDIAPQIVPVSGDLEKMLERADAALLVGDAALRETARHGDALDLVETWVQMTSLPYIHGFWCAREGSIDAHAVEVLQRAKREGMDSFPLIAAESAAKREFPGLSQDDLISYLDQFSLNFPEEAIEGLKEFHHYAFYHGVLADIPEIHLYTPGDDADGEEEE